MDKRFNILYLIKLLFSIRMGHIAFSLERKLLWNLPIEVFANVDLSNNYKQKEYYLGKRDKLIV